MANYCCFCNCYDPDKYNEEKEHPCSLLGINVSAVHNCPGWRPIERTAEEQAAHEAERKRILALSANRPVIPTAKITKPIKAKVSAAKSEIDREELINTVHLYDHQIKAREKFKDIDEVALFFEMGCGKTLTSMMIICDKFKAGKIDSLLVVAPNDVHKQWFDDLCNDESTLSIAIAQEGVECSGQIIGGRGGQKQLYDFDEDDGKLHIVITNIDTFSTPMKWKVITEWANAHKTGIIVDEATVIKNPSSKRTQRMLYEFNDVVRRRNTILASVKKNPVRIVLTGTPVTNGPMDLWAIMEFIKPNYFGRNYYSFNNYYGMHTQLLVGEGTQFERKVPVLLSQKTWEGIHHCDTFMEAASIFGCSEDTYLTVKHQDHYIGPYKHADELKELLEPNAVFAKLTDCVSMPPCNYMIREVALSDAQRNAYASMKADLLATYDDKMTTAKNKLVVSLRLQQISSGFIMAHEAKMPDEDDPFWEQIDNEEYDIKPDEVVWLGDSNPKIEMLLRDIDELDKPLLIMTRFSAEAAKIYDLVKEKYRTCLITGWRTVGSIEGFKKGDFDIMVANTTKIARGHNLQIAHSTIYYSNTFSMELRQQSEFRTFRMGQKQPCTYIDYVACDVDKTVLEALRLKKNLLDYIREKDMEEAV